MIKRILIILVSVSSVALGLNWGIYSGVGGGVGFTDMDSLNNSLVETFGESGLENYYVGFTIPLRLRLGNFHVGYWSWFGGSYKCYGDTLNIEFKPRIDMFELGYIMQLTQNLRIQPVIGLGNYRGVLDIKELLEGGPSRILLNVNDKTSLLLGTGFSYLWKFKNNIVTGLEMKTGYQLPLEEESSMWLAKEGQGDLFLPGFYPKTPIISLGVIFGYENIKPPNDQLVTEPQKAHLVVNVIDQENLKPLKATVTFPETEIKPLRTASRDGSCSLELPPGIYRVRVESDGYKWIERGIVLEEGERRKLEFEMEKLEEEPVAIETPATNDSTIVAITTPPQLTYTVYTTDTDTDGIFEGGETVSLQVSITNSGTTAAQKVVVNLTGSEDLLSRIGKTKQIASIGANETKSVIFSGFLPYDVQAQNVEVRVTLSESQLGKIPQEKLLQVAIAPAPTEVEREVVSRIVDVDQVPARRTTQENAYAVVIGIEEYREEGIPLVSYARSDAEKVREYLMSVVGIRADHIFTILDDDATTVDVAELIEDRLPMVVDEKSLVFIYYAGHGTHDDQGNSYLIPYNGKPSSTRSLYPLSDLNAALAKLPTENVVVALDACFTGGGRSAMAEGARPAVMAKLPDFKHVTLAAAKASQAANAYDQAEHGLFTYYLLKGLKGEADTDSDGWVELGELYEYISDNVSKTAARVLFKEQNPTVIPDNLGGKERMRIGKSR